jgi:hypothetical protein
MVLFQEEISAVCQDCLSVRRRTLLLDDGRQQSNAAAFPDLLLFMKNRVMSPQLKADGKWREETVAGQFLT